MKPAGKQKSLPPWLQKGKDKDAKEDKGKGGKAAVAKGPFGKATAVKKYADGGEVKGMGEKAKPKGSPIITGGFADAIKRREERMAAVERGEPDPGQVKKVKDEEPVKKADGGKIKKGVQNKASNPKATAKNLPMPKTEPLHLKNGGMVKGR
jgi:hypothetical protein